MNFLGSSETAGNALIRSSNDLRSSLASRSHRIVYSIPRMTATPPRNHRLWHPARGISFSPGPTSPATPPQNDQLWHPNRGISFSPGPLPPATLVPSPSSMVDVTVRVAQYHTVVSESMDTHSEVCVQTTTKQTALTRSDLPTTPNLWLQKPTQQVETKEPEKKATDEPPPPVFEYKMVDDLFYAAKKAPPGSPQSFWSYNQYRRVAEDGSLEKVKVHYCRSKHTMERVCQQYFMDEKVLGFDLEWMADSTKRDGLKKNVSLIQIASPSRVALFHVALFMDCQDMVGPSFRSIMEDPNVTKVGVAIKGDTTRLRNYLDIHSRGLMELSNLYKLVTYSRNHEYHKINRRLVPLAAQVEEYLHLPLFKGQDVRSSDWSRPLNAHQVEYSASDAYAGLQLYATLEHHRKQLDPCPPTPHHAELNLAIQLADGVKITGKDDAVEADEAAPSKQDLTASSKKATTALETVSIEDKDIVSPVVATETTKASLVSKETPVPQTRVVTNMPEREKDSRVEVADDRATSYRAAHPQKCSPLPQLRAYYLWHCYDLPPATVAQLLRDPPLKTITVVQYVLAVVQAERLPVDHDRLRELAAFIPLSTLWSRWPVVASMLSPVPPVHERVVF